MNQPTNQPPNQATNQPINQSIKQTINTSTNQSINQTISPRINRSTNQPNNQSTNQSINQSTNQSIKTMNPNPVLLYENPTLASCRIPWYIAPLTSVGFSPVPTLPLGFPLLYRPWLGPMDASWNRTIELLLWKNSHVTDWRTGNYATKAQRPQKSQRQLNSSQTSKALRNHSCREHPCSPPPNPLNFLPESLCLS